MKLRNVVSAFALSLLVGQNIGAVGTLTFWNKTSRPVEVYVEQLGCNSNHGTVPANATSPLHIDTKGCFVRYIRINNNYYNPSIAKGIYEITTGKQGGTVVNKDRKQLSPTTIK